MPGITNHREPRPLPTSFASQPSLPANMFPGFHIPAHRVPGNSITTTAYNPARKMPECHEDLRQFCSWIFEGAKTTEACCQVLTDIYRQGYHLVVDKRLHRYIYKKLKEKGLVRRIRLVNPEKKTRAVRWAIVANKTHLYAVIKVLEKIAEAPTPATWK